MTAMPACKDPSTGHIHPAEPHAQIGTSLAHGGPGCVVAAVHQLTGVAIDHFALIGYSGLVSLSNAVGGVPVCVDNDVYDQYSGLKLAKGTHTVQGQAALAFLRTRHGFGDGGDLGREAALHVYLASLLQQLKNKDTFGDPVALLKVANAATHALTVDKGMASVPALISLAERLGAVPMDQITFATMPSEPDPTNPVRIVPAPAARQVFQALADDTPLPTLPPAGAGGAVTNAAPAPGCVHVSTEDTTLDGTPTAAYARHSTIPDSDR
jgi:LCP family protein required for cell wall assembly